jgi:hypothetical protein
MPPRWPRKPDRKDPAYRKLDDRMNLAVHVAIFAAVNSGVWFVRLVQSADWAWTLWFSLGWLAGLGAHFIYVVAIANYSDQSSSQTPSKPAEPLS